MNNRCRDPAMLWKRLDEFCSDAATHDPEVTARALRRIRSRNDGGDIARDNDLQDAAPLLNVAAGGHGLHKAAPNDKTACDVSVAGRVCGRGGPGR